jgi:hypothetical protein
MEWRTSTVGKTRWPASRERATLIGLTSLWTDGRTAVAPELNRRRAVFVLDKIDEILSWERTKEQEQGRAVCRARGISVRGEIKAVLEVGETDVV